MEVRWLRRINNPEGLVEEEEEEEEVPWSPTVSSPRACGLVDGRMIDALPVGLRRESSSPGPVTTRYLDIPNFLKIINNVLQHPHHIPVETTHKADPPVRVWHARCDRFRVSSAKKWVDFLTVIWSMIMMDRWNHGSNLERDVIGGLWKFDPAIAAIHNDCYC